MELIGDFLCQVSVHPWDDNVACLKCLFREPLGDHAESMQSRETGLSLEKVVKSDDLVTETDVMFAPLEKQASLREQVGRKVCSVIEEAMAQMISREALRARFQPAAPFVASLSGSMVVGELVKAISGYRTALFSPDFSLMS